MPANPISTFRHSRLRRLSSTAIAGLLILLAFQNCSPTFKEPDNTDPRLAALGSEDPQPEPTPTPPPANFRTGDPVDRAALGSLFTFELRGLLDFASYENFTGAKALAIAANGLGAVRATNSGDQEDAERAAIEACNAVSGQNCTLLMSGNTFAVDSDKISAGAKMLLKSGSALLTPADAPFILDSERTLIQNYLNTSSSNAPFKALALAPSGELRYTFGKSQSEANRHALDLCEYDALVPPCLIFAEGNQRIFNLATWDRVQHLRLFPAPVVQERLPFVWDEDLADLDPIFALIAQGRVVSIAIGKTGTFGATQTALKEEADAQALAKCRSNDASCVLYSSNKGVSLRWDNLPSKSVLRAVVCAVPRANCAAHKERGCAANARRWISEAGNLTQKICE